MTTSEEVRVFESSSTLEDGLTQLLQQLAEEAISNRGKFTLGVSGASMVKQLSNSLPKVYEKMNAQWDKWIIFLCDERIVGFEDKESTFGAYKSNLFIKVPELEAQFEVIDPTKDAKENALCYHNKLVKHFGNAIWPKFDLLLLGMGPDGHTCSLFPNHALLKENNKWVAFITDSPKPPPSRITLTLGVLNHARTVAFIVAGDSKKEAVQQILEGGNPAQLPAGLVHPVGGKLIWMLDNEAASGLKR